MYTIYSKNKCPYCIYAKQLLIDKKLVYTEKNIENTKHKSELLTKYPEAKTVPQVFLDDKHIGGYDDLVEFFNQTIFKTILTAIA